MCVFISSSFFSFTQHRNTQETLAVLDRLDLDTEKPSDEELARKFGFEDAYNKGKVSWWQQMKPQMWSLFDEPYSSNAAKVGEFAGGRCGGNKDDKVLMNLFCYRLLE